MADQKRAVYALSVLFAINTMNFFDRQILGAVGELVRKEWLLSDTRLGLLGTAFTLLYALVGVPLGWMADNAVRTRILAAGVTVWSILTAASGMARNFTQLFIVRLGVGVGEASCAPAAGSLIGDLFPANKRARALSVFQMGLPIGLALSYLVSSSVAQRWGWRSAFYVAGLPGLLCAVGVLFMREPKRGLSEVHDIGDRKREGSSFLLVLSIPTMWWIILSGALHNFNMYAIGSFLAPFVMRFHGATLRQAGLISMVVYGLSGVPGLLIGGWAGDAIVKRRKNGRLLIGALAIAASVPLVLLGLNQGRGHLSLFVFFMGMGVGVSYVYYSTVYSTIHDLIEPRLRGTAMALYFCAMYVLGASLGPVGTGLASDYFTKRAATLAGVTQFTAAALEPFRGQGLHYAMYFIPALGVILAIVLVASAVTAPKDMERLERWMREAGTAAAGPVAVKRAVGE